MNIQSTHRNPVLQSGQQKIQDLQKKLYAELSAIDDITYQMEEYDPDLYELSGFVDDQNVGTHTSELAGWKKTAKIVAGALAGAALGYQGGKLGAISNGGLAVAGITVASLQEGAGPEIHEIPNGILAAGAVALPGYFGGIAGAIGGAIAGGLAVTFAEEHFNP